MMTDLCLFRWFTTKKLHPTLALELEQRLAEALAAGQLPPRLSLIRFGVGEDSAEFLVHGDDAAIIAMMAGLRAAAGATAVGSLLGARFEIQQVHAAPSSIP